MAAEVRPKLYSLSITGQHHMYSNPSPFPASETYLFMLQRKGAAI